jgi:hypothetical protein
MVHQVADHMAILPVVVPKPGLAVPVEANDTRAHRADSFGVGDSKHRDLERDVCEIALLLPPDLGPNHHHGSALVSLGHFFHERAQIMSSPAYAALMSSEFIGQRDFEIMDKLGDILNRMDAAQDVPVFVDQAFEHGREMFGANQGGAYHGKM